MGQVGPNKHVFCVRFNLDFLSGDKAFGLLANDIKGIIKFIHNWKRHQEYPTHFNFGVELSGFVLDKRCSLRAVNVSSASAHEMTKKALLSYEETGKFLGLSNPPFHLSSQSRRISQRIVPQHEGPTGQLCLVLHFHHKWNKLLMYVSSEL